MIFAVQEQSIRKYVVKCMLSGYVEKTVGEYHWVSACKILAWKE